MRAAKVVIGAATASFRHPFFVVGRQPTFDMPPPSTIFGHCASALGRWPARSEFWFGIHFTFRSRARDLEHQHVTTSLSQASRIFVPTAEGPARATTEVSVQPVLRDFLFGVRMTLYLPLVFADAFRNPVYPVVLGRSQDLAEIERVEEIDLVVHDRARLEHTLLPQSLRPGVTAGTTALLSRFVGEPPERPAEFAQYIILHEPVFVGGPGDSPRTFIHFDGADLGALRCDPTERDDEGYYRGVWIHRLD
jgi:CRISPR-associated protein Cas5t